MQFDYFYGSQAEQFSFYRIPKVLFTDPPIQQSNDYCFNSHFDYFLHLDWL